MKHFFDFPYFRAVWACALCLHHANKILLMEMNSYNLIKLNILDMFVNILMQKLNISYVTPPGCGG